MSSQRKKRKIRLFTNLGERFYEFKVSDGSRLHSSAKSKSHALKKAKEWEKWVAKKGFTGLKTKYVGLVRHKT